MEKIETLWGKSLPFPGAQAASGDSAVCPHPQAASESAIRASLFGEGLFWMKLTWSPLLLFKSAAALGLHLLVLG